MIGIVDYGIYIPQGRIKLETIAKSWRKSPPEVVGALGVTEKAVAARDEDAVTLAIEAACRSLTSTTDLSDIAVLLVGSESHPYAVNPTSTIVGEFLGIGNSYLAADLQFACKAGTAAMQLIFGLIDARKVKQGIAIGADTAQSRPHDVLEYTSASASAAYLLGRDNLLANLIEFTSYSSDTPDFWRRDGMRYPSHAGRFTGKPAYFAHVVACAKQLMQQAKITPQDVDYCVFHMPNGKFPREAGRALGFCDVQLEPSLTVEKIGNPYSASSLVGLAAVLETAKPKQKIFMVSYGSGAGSDGFLWETTSEISKIKSQKSKMKQLVNQQIDDKHDIDYTEYLQRTHKI